MQIILKESIYEKVKQSCDALYPHLEMLDGGYNQKSRASGFKALGTPISTKTEADVEKACKAIWEWLKKPDDSLRAYLTILFGAGIVYAAQCEEKVLRSFVTSGGATFYIFYSAAKARLCTEDGVSIPASQDDFALTQG